MKTFTGSTLGIVAAFIWMNAAGLAQAQDQDQTQTNSTPPTADSSTSPTYTAPPKDNNSLPIGVQSSSPLAQVIRLLQAGIDENIIQSYITNSTSTFNLDSSRIIYLTDLGAPSSLVTMMMQKDQAIQQQIASSTPTPTPQYSPATDSTATYATDTTTPPPPATDGDAADVATTTPPPEVTVNYFYDNLAPYGNWVDVDGYGRCWRPSVVVYDSAWQPYGGRGHWVSTDCGWYWQSEYALGCTFHYGRWFRDPRFGWCWWPDTVWAPSWVTWRYTDDYCGWAPLPPHAIYAPNAGFLYRGNGISVGLDFGLACDDFIFVSCGHFCDPHPFRYRCPYTAAGQIYAQSTVFNNLNTRDHDGHHFVFNGGIPPQHFEQFAGTPIHTVPVRTLANPYSPHPIHVYGAQAGNQGPVSHSGPYSYYNPGGNNNHASSYGNQGNTSIGMNAQPGANAYNHAEGSTAKFGAPNQNTYIRGNAAGQTSLHTHQYSPNVNNQAVTPAPGHYQASQTHYAQNEYSPAPANLGAVRPTPTYEAPRQNYNQLPTHTFNPPAEPQHYAPAPAPAPEVHYSAPQQHYSEPQHSSPPPQQSYSSGGGNHGNGGGSNNSDNKHH